jgi:malate/lactate dehydrogenase
MRSVSNVTPEGECYSGAILSDGNRYGVPEGLMFSFPLRTLPDGSVVPVEGITLSDFARSRLLISAQELLEEREAIADLLK